MTNYRIQGMTDDTDTCEVCGRVELRRVVMLAVLDADGNTEEIVYAGTTCAARKLAQRGTRVRPSRIADAAAAADRVMGQAREFAAEFAPFTLNQYIAANHIGLMNATNSDTAKALELAKRHYAELRQEIATINSGKLDGTRFAAMLPTI